MLGHSDSFRKDILHKVIQCHGLLLSALAVTHTLAVHQGQIEL